MLARAYRLTDSDSIESVKAKGKKISSKNFIILYKKSGDSKYTKFAIVVSKNISKSASIRNKVKRAISEAIRLYMFNIKPGYDCVVIARPSSARVLTRDLMREVDEKIADSPISKN